MRSRSELLGSAGAAHSRYAEMALDAKLAPDE
jgi:hypothetical protein